MGAILAAGLRSVTSRIVSDKPEDWEFQTGPIHGFGLDRSPFYEMMVAYEFTTTTLMMCAHMGTYTIILGSMVHVTGHYKNLKHYMESIISRRSTIKVSYLFFFFFIF